MNVSTLTVPDEIVIGFFSAVVVALASAVAVLYFNARTDRRDRREEEKKCDCKGKKESAHERGK